MAAKREGYQQMVLQVPKELHKRFKLMAVTRETTMAALVLGFVEREVEKWEKKK